MTDGLIAVFALFDEFSDSFGLPDPEHRERQCEFTTRMNAIICRHRGHTMVPDQCGKPEHDYCVRCGITQSDLESYV